MVISCKLVHESRPRGYSNHLQCMRAQVQSQLFPHGFSVIQYEVVKKNGPLAYLKLFCVSLFREKTLLNDMLG